MAQLRKSVTPSRQPLLPDGERLRRPLLEVLPYSASRVVKLAISFANRTGSSIEISVPTMNPICGQMNLIIHGDAEMVLAITTICAALLVAVVLAKRMRDRRELERHTVTPEALHLLLASNQGVSVFDVRQPLDLLGDPVIIPGAQRLAPEEVCANPSLLPKERDLIVYCTCPSDRTSRTILHRALAMGFVRIKFLKGGLDGWRGNGFPVEPYEKTFHLNSGETNHPVIARS
jgi:rhodanese-related sulfurtransferase